MWLPRPKLCAATTGEDDYGAGLRTASPSISRHFSPSPTARNGVYWLDGGAVQHMPAFKVTAIDSLGAGDAFHGAFTLCLAEGRALDDILRFASATAALKCMKFGGASAAPKRAEVEAFLKNNRIEQSFQIARGAVIGPRFARTVALRPA